MQAVLSSWKEVAQHMGKGIRTVQRWEHQAGLPVHRPSGTCKGVVLAYPSELSAWAHRSKGGKLDERNEVWKRNRELSLELLRRARSLRTSSQQLRERCQFLRLLAERRRGTRPAGVLFSIDRIAV